MIDEVNYLEAYNPEIGLLINFGETSLNFKRLANKKFKSAELKFFDVWNIERKKIK